MPKLSPAALKMRIASLQKQLAAAEADKGPAIKKVRTLMKQLGVSISDLTAPADRRPRSSKGKSGENASDGAKPRSIRGKVAIKYRDEHGNTWTGRGKTPRWLTEAEAAGRTRDSFKIS